MASITINPSSLSFGSDAGTQTVEITTSGDVEILSATASASWITAELSGDTLTVSAAANTGEARSGTITVSGSDAGEATVYVSQSAASVTITADPTSLSFEAAGGSEVVSLSTSGDAGTLSATASASWITAELSGDTLTVSAAANTGKARSGTITVSGSDAGEATISVKQSSAISVSASKMIFYPGAGSQAATITVEDWVGEIKVSSSASWLTAEISGDAVIVSTTASTETSWRSGVVTLTGSEGGSATIIVSQRAAASAMINADPTSLSFEASGGSGVVSLSTSGDVGTPSVLTGKSWITTAISGDTLTVSVSQNTSTSSRRDELEVQGSEGGITTIAVTQRAADSATITADPTSLSFEAAGGSEVVSLSADAPAGTLSATASASWITAAISDDTLTVSVTQNGTAAARSGTVTVTGSDAGEATVYVSQSAASVTITADPTSLSFEAAGGSEVVSLSTSGDAGTLSATASADWITATLREPLALVRALFDGPIVTGVGADLSFDGTATGATVALSSAGYANWAAGSYSASGGYSYKNSANWILISNSGISWRGSWTISVAVKSISGQAYAAWDNIFAVGGSADHIRVQINTASETSAVGLFARRTVNNQEVTVLYGTTTYTAAVSPDDWTLLTLTYAYDAATETAHVALYANGEKIGENLSSEAYLWAFPETTSTVVSLGAPATGATGTRFIGLFDELAIYDAAISATEIEKSLLNQTPPLALPTVVEIATAENDSTAARSGYVEVSGAAGVIPATIAVSQAGRDPAIAVSPTSLVFSAAGGEDSLSVVALADDVAWTASTSADWLTLSPESGTGSAAITVTATFNASDARTASIFVAAENGDTATISVSQSDSSDGETILNVSPLELSFAKAGGTHGVVVQTNVADWTFSTSGAATFSATKNAAGLTVVAAARTDEESDIFAATITITAGTASRTVQLTQTGTPWAGTIPSGNGTPGTTPSPEVITGDTCLIRGVKTYFPDKTTLTGGVNVDGSEEWHITISMRRELMATFVKSARLYNGSTWTPVPIPSRNTPPIAGWTIEETSPGSAKIKIRYAIETGTSYDYSTDKPAETRTESIDAAEVERSLAECGSLWNKGMDYADRAKVAYILQQYWIYKIGGNEDQLATLDSAAKDLAEDLGIEGVENANALSAKFSDAWQCIQNGQTAWVDYVTQVTVTQTLNHRPTPDKPGGYDSQPDLHELAKPSGYEQWQLCKDAVSATTNGQYTRVRVWRGAEIKSPIYAGK